MNLIDFAWIILLLPLAAAGLITLFFQRDSKFSAHLSIGAVVLSFFFSLALFIALKQPLQAVKAIEATPISWQLVGLSSYLLIGFWYERAVAADAAKKAFLTNRFGDFGFMLGIVLLWATLGSVNFDQLQQALVTNPGALGVWSSVAGLLIFCG